jgi:hypothetical protein
LPLPGPSTLADMLQRARDRLSFLERELERREGSGGEIDRTLLAEATRARNDIEILERALKREFG